RGPAVRPSTIRRGRAACAVRRALPSRAFGASGPVSGGLRPPCDPAPHRGGAAPRWRRARFAVLLQIPRPPLRGGRAAPERGAGTRILEGRAARSADAAAAGRGAGGTARSAVSGTRTRRSARSRGARAGAPDHPKITERGAGGVVCSSARGRSGPDGPEGGRRPGRRSRGPRPPLGGRRAGPPASGKGRRGGLVRTVGMLLPSAPDFV